MAATPAAYSDSSLWGSLMERLPDALLSHLLQHVPSRPRLSVCALVCRRWEAAVAGTTVDICYATACSPQDWHRSGERWKQLLWWLSRHANRVLSITLQVNNTGLQFLQLQLPCSAPLKHLEAACGRLQMNRDPTTFSITVAGRYHSAAPAAASSNTAPGAAAPLLPHLESVRLKYLTVSLPDLLLLSQPTSLTSLALTGMDFTTSDPQPATKQQATTAVCSLLSQMTDLNELELIRLRVTEPASQEFPGAMGLLNRLQRLKVDNTVCPDLGSVLPRMPTSLTALQLQDVNVAPTPAQMQAATRLSSLAVLEVGCAEKCAWLNPSILSHMPLLRSFSLSRWAARPVSENGAQHRVAREPQEAEAGEDSGSEDSEAAQDPEQPQVAEAAEALDPVQYEQQFQRLLTAISQLKQLQDLNLDSLRLPAGLQMQQYSLLTVSPQLESLEIRNDPVPLPFGALQHMLRPGHVLRQLRTLTLSSWTSNEQLRGNTHCVDGADCCPALTSLRVAGALVSGASLAGLTGLHATLRVLKLTRKMDCDDTAMACLAQLTRLSCLECGAGRVTEAGLQHLTALHATPRICQLTDCKDTAMASLAQLTSLRYLHCSGGSLTEAGLQHLTALQRLTYLWVYGSGMRSVAARACELNPAGRRFYGKSCLLLKAPLTAGDPNVWQLSRVLTPGADDEGVVGSLQLLHC